jgi:hypothetical protein
MQLAKARAVKFTDMELKTIRTGNWQLDGTELVANRFFGELALMKTNQREEIKKWQTFMGREVYKIVVAWYAAFKGALWLSSHDI